MSSIRYSEPIVFAMVSASLISLFGKTGEDPIRARTFSLPIASMQALRSRVLSIPPEKATTTLSMPLIIPFNLLYLSISSIGYHLKITKNPGFRSSRVLIESFFLYATYS